MLKDISDALMGLKGEMEENRNNTQQIQEKQTQMERKIEEEEKNKVGEGAKKGIASERRQEDKQHGGIRYEQTNVPHNSSV